MNNITMTLNADELIKMALREDISSEDVTTNSVMTNNPWGYKGVQNYEDFLSGFVIDDNNSTIDGYYLKWIYVTN